LPPAFDPTKKKFLRFFFFGIKLGHFTINNFFLYVTKTQAYQQKTEKRKKVWYLEVPLSEFAVVEDPNPSKAENDLHFLPFLFHLLLFVPGLTFVIFRKLNQKFFALFQNVYLN